MVTNIKNGNTSGTNAYQANNQKLEQVKQDTAKQAEISQTQVNKTDAKDTVALTPQVKQLKDLQKRISESEGFDRKKVDDIKKAIADGEYKIDYDKLADKIASFEFDL